MQNNEAGIPWRKLVLTVAVLAVWVSVPVIGYVDATGTTSGTQCNGPLSADLTGTAAANAKGPSGSAQFKEKGKNGLTVKIRGLDAAQTGALSVYVDDTSVGSITPKSGGGDLKLDTVTATINEGSTISVRNGTDTLLSGTFICKGGGGNRNSNSGRNSNGNTNGNMNMNTNMNMNMNMNVNTNANTGGTPRPRS
jgi:hypothetical protein